MGFLLAPSKIYRFNEFRARAAAEGARSGAEAAEVYAAKRAMETYKESPAYKKMTEEAKTAWQKDKEQGVAYADTTGKFFCFNDPNLRGSIASAIAAKGCGASAELSINPFGFVGLNTEIKVAQSLKGAKQRAIVMCGGPASFMVDGAARAVPMPIITNSFIGVYFESKSQVGIEVSVGFEAKAVLGAENKKPVSPETKTESKGGSTELEPPKPGVLAEIAVAKFEAKAGAKAEASYTYEMFVSDDPLPLFFERRTGDKLKASIEAILEEGSIKTFIKSEACDHINANSARAYGGHKSLSVHKSALWGAYNCTLGTAEVLKVLRSVKTIDPAILGANESLISRLSSFESSARPGKHLLILSSHKGDGKAGVFASAEATATVVGYGASASASAFYGISGAYKRAYARYQNALTTEAYARPGANWRRAEVVTRHPAEVMTTYDTVISYSSCSLGPEFELKANAFTPVGGYDAMNTGAGKRVKGGLEAAAAAMTWNVLNRMRYRTAIACWVRPEPGLAPLTDSVRIPTIPRLRGLLTSPLRVSIDAVVGTGVAYGESFVVGNLNNLYDRLLDDSIGDVFMAGAEEDTQIVSMAETLNAAPGKVLEFLADAEVMAFIRCGIIPESGAVLIEATYRVESVALEIDVHFDGDAVFHAALASDTGDKLFKAAKDGSVEMLESIRLRYRLRDVKNADKTLFSLGFEKMGAGNKLKIGLERVDRSGSDAIMDVRTVFVHPALKSLHASDPGAAYDSSVPPAALFCQ